MPDAVRVKSAPNLRQLNEAVNRATSERFRPHQPGEEPRTIFPLVEYLDATGERATWRAMQELRDREPALYNRFVGERFLRDLVVEVVADHEGPIDFPDLVEEVGRRADSGEEWLVAVPLANFLVPGGYLLVQEWVAALGMSVQDPDWTPTGTEAPVDAFAMFRDLKDRLDTGIRWWRDNDPFGRLDTRMTAKLFLVQRGTETAALSIAATRARLALAIWCLFDPPGATTLWPTLGDWLPRPYLATGTVHKLYEQDKFAGSAHAKGRWTHQYAEYTVTEDARVLAAPFEMMRLAETMVAPRAVASAAWALHQAEREPNELERTDRLVHLRAAIEAICDTGEGPSGGVEKRWARVTERFGIWKEMRGVYGQRELEDAKRLARDLRNISQHGSDDILVNLGYPPEAIRPLKDGRTLTVNSSGWLAQRQHCQSFSVLYARSSAVSRRTGARTDGMTHASASSSRCRPEPALLTRIRAPSPSGVRLELVYLM
jgi:hypothetical protein